ncbi:VOC family protein [Mycobacterium sp. M1]|uniref:VOC family protein n=1 Tax=Mycolicibacter acidiphilus TaxID=2835306 RepID=A0ABS5RGP4_9MYCO|nr:VOC family protein [Mycolicibacter acidiphilus]MBS9532626.1 VOC family protein [Mycolicibacter acidiphilus]
MPTLTALTLICTSPARTASFYRQLGVNVIEPTAGDPAYHLHLGPVLVQLWQASALHPATRIGITLTVVPEILDRFPDAEPVTPRGCAAVVDPDGNRVLLTASRDVGEVVGDII